jgi:CDP-diacylglycerol pyrophosphatase
LSLFSNAARSLPRLIAAAIVVVAVCGSIPAQAGSRDILWTIISSCLDPTAPDYCEKCEWPRTESACAAETFCKETTEVWAENAQFVALRDRKMCGCPSEFIHGLVVPKSRVTGVEDRSRPDAIWAFAWATAMKKIGDESVTALVVNPAADRGQDQLHVHILRLAQEGRRNFGKAHVTCIDNLDDVWKAAGKMAETAGWDDYGVLVAKRPEGGFLVLIDQASPEKGYTQPRCR